MRHVTIPGSWSVCGFARNWRLYGKVILKNHLTMANQFSDIEAVPSAGNSGDIDCRAVLQCEISHPTSTAPSQSDAGSHALLVRSTSMAPKLVPQLAHHSYPPLSRAGIDGVATHGVAEPVGTEVSVLPCSASLQALLRLRQVRATLFPEKIFVQPAWDMLLELLECHLRQRRISVSGLYLAAGIPPATALRRMQDMEDAGLIVRVSDPNDRRRQFVELTSRTLRQFQAFVRHGDVVQTLRMGAASIP
jgi:DNA-binding MarR family transcriptional regulator